MGLSENLKSRLINQPDTLDIIIHDMTESRLRERVNADKWSAYEQIAHLAAYQPVFLKRIDAIIREDGPLFGRYIADNDPLFQELLRFSLEDLKKFFFEKRHILIQKASGLTETELKRPGKHAKYGNINLATWIDFFLLHEAHHLFSIFMMVQEWKAANHP